MDKKTTAKMAAAAAALTGAGAAVMLAKKKKNSQKESASAQVPVKGTGVSIFRGTRAVAERRTVGMSAVSRSLM